MLDVELKNTICISHFMQTHCQRYIDVWCISTTKLLNSFWVTFSIQSNACFFPFESIAVYTILNFISLSGVPKVSNFDWDAIFSWGYFLCEINERKKEDSNVRIVIAQIIKCLCIQKYVSKLTIHKVTKCAYFLNKFWCWIIVCFNVGIQPKITFSVNQKNTRTFYTFVYCVYVTY